MCHAVRVKLSSGETKAVKEFYGRLVPVYASIALLIAGAVALSSLPRSGDVAVASNGTATDSPGRDSAR